MKYARLYITPNDIKEKLVEKTDKTNVIFTNVKIGTDGFVEIECVVTEDQLENKIEHTQRQRFFG